MKITGLSESDIRHLHRIKTIIESGDFKVGGKEMHLNGRSLDWLQELVKACAQEFAAASQKVPVTPAVEVEKASTAAPVEPEPPQPGGLPKGARIKAFHPGKAGK